MIGDLGVGTWGQPVHDPRAPRLPEKLTVDEYFSLFHRTPDDTRGLGAADSEEYLAVVTYLVQRNVEETR
jgi:hypothetical protein